MPLSRPLIGELRVILREEYGVDVSDKEAKEIGTNLVRYFSLLAKIDSRESSPPEPPQPTARGTGPP